MSSPEISQADSQRYYEDFSLKVGIRDWSSANDRHEQLKLFVADVLQGRCDLELLDVGCGAGVMTAYLVRFGQVTGLDFSAPAIALARQMVPEAAFSTGRIEDLPSGARFDVLTLFDVLEHIPIADRPGFFAELAERLRPGGIVFASTPYPAFTRWRRTAEPHELQIIDEEVWLDAVIPEAESVDLSVLRYQAFDLWQGSPEYQFFVFGERAAAGQGPVLRRPELDARMRLARRAGGRWRRVALGASLAGRGNRLAALRTATGDVTRLGQEAQQPPQPASRLKLEQVRLSAHAEQRLVLGGEHVECPCCDRRANRFIQYHRRPLARCPHCGARERHRALWLYLRHELRLGDEALSLLHFAPEPEISEKIERLERVAYTTADLEVGRAREAMDITSIPRPEATFDVVLISHVLEHVPDDGLALSELLRVLKPGGRAVLQHPIDFGRARTYEDDSIRGPELQERHFGQFDHVRVYGRDFLERVRAAGFGVSASRYERTLSRRTRVRYGLKEYTGNRVRGMDVYLAVKPAS